MLFLTSNQRCQSTEGNFFKCQHPVTNLCSAVVDFRRDNCVDDDRKTDVCVCVCVCVWVWTQRDRGANYSGSVVRLMQRFQLLLLLHSSTCHYRCWTSYDITPSPRKRGQPAGFWLGGQCPLAAWGEIFFEKLTAKWCILKYIWINMWSV